MVGGTSDPRIVSGAGDGRKYQCAARDEAFPGVGAANNVGVFRSCEALPTIDIVVVVFEDWIQRISWPGLDRRPTLPTSALGARESTCDGSAEAVPDVQAYDGHSSIVSSLQCTC